jgi:hypothetical protein
LDKTFDVLWRLFGDAVLQIGCPSKYVLAIEEVAPRLANERREKFPLIVSGAAHIAYADISALAEFRRLLLRPVTFWVRESNSNLVPSQEKAPDAIVEVTQV